MTIIAASTLSGAYRPPQWSKASVMVSVTVPNAGALAGLSTNTGPITYVFDAVLELNHEQRVTKTRHPVQTGSDVSSHAYLMPAKCTMLIGMSDAMDAYASTSKTAFTPYKYPNYTAWTGSDSKSVSAYQTLLSLLKARQSLTITTKLQTYTNMLLMSLTPHEDSTTITGLRAQLEFEQIFMASVTTTSSSSRTDATVKTNVGSVSPTTVPTSTKKQFSQSSTTLTSSGVKSIAKFIYAGGGKYSSNCHGGSTTSVSSQ